MTCLHRDTKCLSGGFIELIVLPNRARSGVVTRLLGWEYTLIKFTSVGLVISASSYNCCLNIGAGTCSLPCIWIFTEGAGRWLFIPSGSHIAPFQENGVDPIKPPASKYLEVIHDANIFDVSSNNPSVNDVGIIAMMNELWYMLGPDTFALRYMCRHFSGLCIVNDYAKAQTYGTLPWI